MTKARKKILDRLINNWHFDTIANTIVPITIEIPNFILNYEVKHFNRLLIYTDRPGYLIGYKGNTIKTFEKALRDNGFKLHIEFIELTNYVSILKRYNSSSFIHLLKSRLRHK